MRTCAYSVATVVAAAIFVVASGPPAAAATARAPYHPHPCRSGAFATPRAVGAATASRHPPRRRTIAPRKRTRSQLAGKKYADKDIDQPEVLRDLDARVAPYAGRLESKAEPRDANAGGAEEAAAPHRCGLVTLLGRPNAGKSTLLNALLADELAIATPRPQTTRHAILGVLTTATAQLCFTDTPGIIGAPAYRLQEGMMNAVRGAVRDADAFLVVTDAYGEDATTEDGEDPHLGLGEDVLATLRRADRPVLVCVNKSDLVAPARAARAVQRWRAALPAAVAILPTCAAGGTADPGVAALRALLLAGTPGADAGAAVRALGRPVPGTFAADGGPPGPLLPVGPPLYPPDFLTDRTERFCAAELIRGTLFARLDKELPYCCEVRVETFDEARRDAARDPAVRIAAAIVVERDSQVGIVVGKGGAKIKEVGVEARQKLHELLGVRVVLDLRVRVEKNWRNDGDKLKKYGYR